MDKKISRALTFEEMRDAALKGERGNFNLDQAIQAMLEYKSRGESVSYRFNGFKLESDEISADEIEKVHEEYGKALSTKLPRELYAEEMRDAALKGERGNFNLEQAVQAMLEYKAKGESVYYVFNGFELNSDDITSLEDTIEKYDRFLRRERKAKQTTDTVENDKTDKYFKLLHPEYDTLSPEEQEKLARDKTFIEEHLEEIDREYPELMAYYGAPEGSPQVIQDVIKNLKVQTYWRMLYPSLEGLNAKDNPEVGRDRIFIEEHLEEIDREYPELMAYYGASEGDPQVIQDVINNIKRAQAIREKISVQKIGQATINTPTTVKKEAEQVENGENTRNNIKEGEEVGDDN